MPAVAITGLTKRFGDTTAVDNLHLRVERGSFFGLVGPNGAGKSTTLKACTGLLRPDAGTVTVNGTDVWADPVKAKQTIGVVPEEPRLFDRLTGTETLTYIGRLRQLPAAVVAERSAGLFDALGLTDTAGRLVSDYSTGMKKKMALAAAVLHRPSVLFLDEPFESVDPVSVRAIRQILLTLTEQGATVVFSSHVMEVVERLCDRVAVVNEGRIVVEGDTVDVCAGRRLEDVFAEAVNADGPARTLTWL